MKSTLQVPAGKRALPWLAAAAGGTAVWLGLLYFAEAAGALSIYVGAIAGLNVYAFVAAGIARPVREDNDDSFILNPRDEMLGGREGA
jgi:hypothetical protein